jgi:HTH-type transcriptional regulator / antitoxin HipB
MKTIRISTAKDFGKLIRQVRLQQKLKQIELATASGTGERFIVDLEGGKPTCELEKSLHVARMLGIKLDASSPLGPSDE